MKRVAKFEKVSIEEFSRACVNIGINNPEIIKRVYDGIRLPQRATSGSAGYDFYAPLDIILSVDGESVVIPTGIRCQMDGGYVLMLYPRSGLGFKYKLRLNNTVGVIDGDYYYSDNEGHIMAKLSNEGEKKLVIEQGKAFMQGILTEYAITEDDDTRDVRNGGFGSTDK